MTGLLRNDIFGLRSIFVTMKHRALRAYWILFVLFFAALLCSHEVTAQARLDSPEGAGVKAWPSQPPAGIPFEASKELTGIAFTGRHAQYGHADTWYPSWAADRSERASCRERV